MKRIVILFLIMIFLRIMSFSQNISVDTNQDTIVSITSEQLKYSNLIFIDHEKLLIENSLLSTQLEKQKSKIQLLEKTDSMRVNQIHYYKGLESNYSVQIENLNKTIKNKDKTIKIFKIGGITISCGLLLLLIIK